MRIASAKKEWVLLVIVTVLFLGGAMSAHAFEWGGRFNNVIPCFNGAIYAATGAPKGGAFIWTPITHTFQYGPPSHAGQYGLGLAAPPYFCVVSPYPVIVLPGIVMTMLGTSR